MRKKIKVPPTSTTLREPVTTVKMVDISQNLLLWLLEYDHE